MSAAVSIRDAFAVFDSPAGGTAALQGLSLEVEPGEIVVLLGPSGSGKTTLLRVVAGFERLAAGSVTVLGTDITRLDARAADRYRARSLGMLDQHYARSLSPDLTCRQTIALQLELLGHEAGTSARVADHLLASVGLADRADERPGALSGGEQQRVAVCAAVAHRPGLLLADEPAGELDAENAEIVYGVLSALVRETQATALIVSHDQAATAIADRIVHLRDGRVVEERANGGAPALVVSRGGWIRVPEPLLRGLGSPDLVAVEPAPESLALRAVAGAARPAALASVAQPAAVAGAGEVVAEVRGLAKRFGAQRTVFDGLSAEFRGGRYTAVVGRSGSGKTTLLHILAGLERPTEGDVLLGGRPLAPLSRAELAELRRTDVALVTQEPGLVPYLTALENVELGLQLRGSGGGGGDAACRALATVGLETRLDAACSRLSAGERQRVAIARALAADVRLLLVDEPTARLDEENARLVADLLARAAHGTGLAVVCATHDPVLVELADVTLSLAASATVAA